MAQTPHNGEYRYKKWALRFSPASQSLSPAMERLMLDPDQVMPAFTRTCFDAIYTMEGLVRGVLDLAGVSVILYPFYLSFGRQMWKLTGRISGESAAIEAELRIVLWVARGLSRSVLEDIRTNVFQVGPPSSP